MLKLTVGVLAFVLAGSASAAGWRSMRIDASSEASFDASVIAFRDKLPFVRRQVFERSLQDIWVAGVQAAQADGRNYSIDEYLLALDGLGYKDVVRFTDPSGDTADRYWDQAYVSLYRRGNPAPAPRSAGSGGWMPRNPPREAGQSRTVGNPPHIGVNPWQR